MGRKRIKRPEVPSLHDLRWHMEDLFRQTNLTNKALSERCNERRDPRHGAATPPVSPDTISRIRGVAKRQPRPGEKDPGFGVAYATVAHVYTVLRALDSRAAPDEPITRIMVSKFRRAYPVDQVDEILQHMGRNGFAYAPYEMRKNRKRHWLTIERDKLQEVSDEGLGEKKLKEVLDQIRGGRLILKKPQTKIRELQTRRVAWDLCLVLERMREPVGLIAPYDMLRVGGEGEHYGSATL